MTRIAVLWSEISGYLAASLRALEKHNCSLFLSVYEPAIDAPFHKNLFSWISDDKKLWWAAGAVNSHVLYKALDTFQPDVILCSGWSDPVYLYVSKQFKAKAIRVLCIDTPWRGTLRQWLGKYWVRVNIRPNFERVFVPGERQFQTAIKLGFKPRDVIFGLLAPDTALFTPCEPFRFISNKTFLYVGRLSAEKGVHEIAKAYQQYRAQVEDPWALVIAGTGQLQWTLEDIAGVKMLGFVQPGELPAVLFQAGCLVVPSLFESWGVQISEAVTAGLPIIGTLSCGACPHLVRNYFNGYLVEAGDVAGLTRAMKFISAHSDLSTYAKNSRLLSRQFTPDNFAINLLESCSSLLEERDREQRKG